MAKIGSETKPVYVGANGDARPCDLELHDISVENKGDNEVIAIIKIDNVPYEIKNIKQGGTAFSVTFKDWNGTVLKTEAVLKGGNATPPTNPTREGYDFKSWSGTYTNVQADQVVTATYQIKTFTVIFRQLKDGTYTTLKTQTGVQWGTAATAPDKPSVTGYNTSDWDKTFTSIKADTTVTCTLTKKTYTITFKNNGGTVLQSKLWNYGDTPSYGSTPTAENQDPSKTYTFTGWSPTITTVTADATYTAQYSTAVKTKTVTFKLDGGNISGSTADVVRTVNYGTAYTSVTKPDNPTKTGYNFTGWGDPVPASAINASGQVIDNCVVTAQYEWTYVSRDYFTVLGSGTSSPGERIRDGSGPVGGDGFHTASENGYSNKIKLDIGSRYRITIDDGHMCLPADRSYTTIDDGYCVVFYTYTDTAMTQGANVRITDAISGNVMSAFGSASNYLISHNLHNGTIDYDSWPQSSMWNGSFHYCSEGNAYIRSGGGEEDYPPVGGAKLIFETETLSQDIYLKLLLSPTSGVYANARWTVEKIS